LDELSTELEEIERNPANSTTARYYTEYLYLFSLYKYKQRQYFDAIQKNLEALKISVTIGDHTAFKKLVVLFEVFRGYSSTEQEQHYKTQLKNILEGMVFKEKRDFFQFYSRWL
jgi:hypothetical protein